MHFDRETGGFVAEAAPVRRCCGWLAARGPLWRGDRTSRVTRDVLGGEAGEVAGQLTPAVARTRSSISDVNPVPLGC